MLHVMEHPCNECLFSKNKIIEENAKESLIEECLKKDMYFICHKATIIGKDYVCKGFWDRYKSDVVITRMALAWGFWKFVKIIEPKNPES